MLTNFQSLDSRLPQEVLAGTSIGLICEWGHQSSTSRVSARITEQLLYCGADVHVLHQGCIGDAKCPGQGQTSSQGLLNHDLKETGAFSLEEDSQRADAFRDWLERINPSAVLFLSGKKLASLSSSRAKEEAAFPHVASTPISKLQHPNSKRSSQSQGSKPRSTLSIRSNQFPGTSQDSLFNDRLELLKERNIRAIGYFDWQQLDDEQESSVLGSATIGRSELQKYQAVITPHKAGSKLLMQMEVPAIDFRWGWRPPFSKPRLKKNSPLRFLHLAGPQSLRYADSAQKTTNRVIEAFLKLADRPDFEFHVLSPQGISDVKLRQQMQDAGIQLDEGHLPAERIEAHLRGARVAVIPSRWEGAGLSILESLSVGTPVITTNGSPMNEWVRHKKEGLLIRSDRQPLYMQALDPSSANKNCDFTTDELVNSLLMLEDRDLLHWLEKKTLAGGGGRMDPEDCSRLLGEGIAARIGALT